LNKIREIISAEDIAKEVKKLGEKITTDYSGKELVIIGVLKGAFVFLSDLVRAISLPCQIEFMQAQSYSGVTSTGIVNITKDIEINIKGKDIIVVEDILDTGRTLYAICETLRAKEANSVKVCTFLDKPSRRVVDMKADYSCFVIPDDFVVGYGLDYDEQYRNLPFIGLVEQE
jgi:hypoxanthine phosphoribosyltransferase